MIAALMGSEIECCWWKPSSNLFLAINENSQDEVVEEVSVSGEDDTDEVDDTFQSNIGNGKDADDIDIDDIDEAS